MQLNNPLQMNDWEIKKTLMVILAIQLAIWGAIGLDAINIHIPLLRQLIGFIYLTFIPGILILRILKLHRLGNIETLLYTIGLSLATLMFIGFFISMVYPIFGISSAISLFPLITTISAVVLLLCAQSYIRDKEFADPAFIDLGEVLSPPVLFLCLIPFMAIFGTYLVNFQHNNILLMLMIAVIAIVALLIGFNSFNRKNLYPLAVFIIAISLLYHRSLISMYIWGWDIHTEFYYSNLVMENFHWDTTIPSGVNAMLSIVMLAPIYSNICSMSITWVFKIFYPVLFALVPLGLYRVFQKQTNDKIAFLSCFFFVSFFTFYTEMLALARQQIAELFLVLLVMLMVDKNMDKAKNSFLFIVFSISLAVSHYGLSYIYMICLIIVWLMLVAGENRAVQKIFSNIFSKFGSKRKRTDANLVHQKKVRKISSTFVLIFVIFAMAWYMFVSSSSAFNAIVKIGDQIAGSIFTDFLNPEAAQGLNIIILEMSSPLHSIAKYLHLLFQFFIFVGIATLMLNYKKMKFERTYKSFSLINFMICVGGIVLPHFASALNTTRLYQITLIFLAPFCVIGGMIVFEMIAEAVKAFWTNKSVRSSSEVKSSRNYLYWFLRSGCSFPTRISLPGNFKMAPVLSVFFAIFLLFNSGWFFEIAKDHPNSIALSQESCRNSKDIDDKVALYNALNVFEQDVYGAKWLSKNRGSNKKIYADCVGSTPLGSYGMIEDETLTQISNTTKIQKETYIYLGYPNVVEKIARVYSPGPQKRIEVYNTTEIFNFLNTTNAIYLNRGCEIYYRGEK